MKKIIITSICLLLSACGGNDDGQNKNTYSSCKITSSEAPSSQERLDDLKQCWDANKRGYESKEDALQWCKRTVNTYISESYLTPHHTVAYAVEKTSCS